MKTDDLINSMAADLPTRPVSPAKAAGLALLVSVPIVFGLLVYALQVRPDFWTSLGQPRFLFKIGFLLSMAGAGLWMTLRSSRPGVRADTTWPVLGGVLAVLLAAVIVELAVVPPQTWSTSLVGTMTTQCLLLIPLMSVVPFIAIMTAMRAGAPDNPALAGAAAGLLASAVGATFYAAHCPNDSPLYVAVWYLIGMAAVTVAGGLVGRSVLRW